jgi:hypothetical protein
LIACLLASTPAHVQAKTVAVEEKSIDELRR